MKSWVSFHGKMHKRISNIKSYEAMQTSNLRCLLSVCRKRVEGNDHFEYSYKGHMNRHLFAPDMKEDIPPKNKTMIKIKLV